MTTKGPSLFTDEVTALMSFERVREYWLDSVIPQSDQPTLRAVLKATRGRQATNERDQIFLNPGSPTRGR